MRSLIWLWLTAGVLCAAPVSAAVINVGDRVWNDVDGDGVQDVDELGISGVVVQLWNEPRNQLFGMTTTDINGIYRLTAPGPGIYRIRTLLPVVSDAFSPLDQGGNDQTDSDVNPSGTTFGFTSAYTFASNLISIATIDAGIERAPEINVGNLVWNDIDRDGTKDAGEPGIAGVTLQLWNAPRTMVLDSTISDSGGAYALAAPGAGEYRVRALLPTGFQFSPRDASGNDATDNDFNPSGATAGFTEIYLFPANLVSISTIDAGMNGAQMFSNGFE